MRPLFVPMFAGLAAEVDGRAPGEFLRDAGRLSLVLRDLAKALPLDAVCVDPGSGWHLARPGLRPAPGFPPEAAAGEIRPLPGDVETAARACPTLEAIRRLADILPEATAVAVAVTGTQRFAALTGREPGEWAQSLNGAVRLALDAGVSVVLVQEGRGAPADAAAWARDLAPVLGSVAFYRGVGAVVLTDPEPAWAAAAASPGASRVPFVVDEAAPDVLAAVGGRARGGGGPPPRAPPPTSPVPLSSPPRGTCAAPWGPTVSERPCAPWRGGQEGAGRCVKSPSSPPDSRASGSARRPSGSSSPRRGGPP